MTRYTLVCLFVVALSCQSAPPVQNTSEAEPNMTTQPTWIPPVPEGQSALKPQWVRAVGRPFTGAATEDALVTIIGFGDYACPDTQRGAEVVADLLTDHPTARYAYVDHDVIDHPFGETARRVAAIARKNQRFFAAHDLLFGDHFRNLTNEEIPDVLRDIEVAGRYRAFEARENATALQKINHEEAQSLGVSWAPTYFVNGVPIVDADPDDFARLVATQEALARSVADETGLRGEALYREVVKRNGAATPPPGAAGTWHIIGYEIVGYRDLERDVIAAEAPFELAREIEGFPPPDICAGLTERLDVAHLDCSVLKYADFTAYATMHLVERGDEDRLAFRAPPSGTDATLPDELVETFDRLQTVQQQRFQTGQPPRESADEGYLDYDDEEMHELVIALRKSVPPHRATLFDVVRHHQDGMVRAKAATLLNWAGDATASIAVVHDLLDDPNGLVRNNISRFMLHYLADVEDAEVRRKVADSLLEQVRRPAMSDQNKALFGLLALGQTSDADRAYIVENGRDWLQLLARQSTLSNVGGVAQRILALPE